MAKQKGGNFKENFYNEFDNFDEQELRISVWRKSAKQGSHYQRNRKS